MPIYKMMSYVNAGTMLSRDVQMITPHFSTINPAPDLNSLTDDMATILANYISAVTPARVTVKCYDAQKHPHGEPLATKTKNTLTPLVKRHPGELALCLSFYSEFNVKRRRGRLYIPLNWIEPTPTVGLRPSTTHRDKVGSLAQQLADLGGIDIDWCVYSRVDDQARSVSDWWVDDEWDIQRRRGDRPTARTAGTVSE